MPVVLPVCSGLGTRDKGSRGPSELGMPLAMGRIQSPHGLGRLLAEAGEGQRTRGGWALLGKWCELRVAGGRRVPIPGRWCDLLSGGGGGRRVLRTDGRCTGGIQR